MRDELEPTLETEPFDVAWFKSNHDIITLNPLTSLELYDLVRKSYCY